MRYSMSSGKGVAVAKSLLGLALGAGVCYCLYRVMSGKNKRKQVSESSILGKVSGLALRTSVQPNRSAESENIPASTDILGPQHIKALLQILLTNPDSSIVEQVLITLSNSAAFSVNHNIIQNLGGIRIISKFLSHNNPRIKVKALNALNNLSMNLQNQEEIKEFISEICKDIVAFPLNSEVQLAGLGLVINMSVTNNYHDKFVDYIPSFLTLLMEGNEMTKKYSLKVLVNLSANPFMTVPLLISKAQPSMAFLFDSCINKDILLRALTFSANLSENFGREQSCHYNENSLYAFLFGDSALLQRNLEPLLQHPDSEVQEQVSRILCKLKDSN